MTSSEPTPPRMSLRGSPLDDVVIEQVEMFRAEMLDEQTLWLACYLTGTGVPGDRIAFEVRARGDRLAFTKIEDPQGTTQLAT